MQRTILDYFGVERCVVVPEVKSVVDEILFDERVRVGRLRVNYLVGLRGRLYRKCETHGGCTPEIIDRFYRIFEDDDILFLVSFFRRDIPRREEYYKRLGEEFQLIKQNNFIKVFLQCIEILELVGDAQYIIRGSAGSSLVTYLLNITNIDPIRENISLARFMSETRKDMPDIDIDLPHNRRERIYQRIFEKWSGKVARISNHVIFRKKTSLKEAVRQAGYRKFLPKDFKLGDIFEKEEDQNSIYEQAAKLEGTFSHYSLHCGGIVIFDDIVPQKYYLKEFNIFKQSKQLSGIKEGPQIKLNKDEVEDENLIKLDILSNRGLSQLMDISSMLIEDYPDGDEMTYMMLGRGENLGITFGESRAMRKIFMLLKPKCIYDIAVCLALVRPCASGGGQKAEFLRDYRLFDRGVFTRENGLDYLIFDDDAIQYIGRILGISEGEADVYRKAFAKNRWDKKAEFIYLLKNKHQEFSEEKIQLIVSLLEQLQLYSFCKSHAYSYAYLVYALAYQKVHNSKVFWLSALNNCNSSFRRWVHFREAKNVGIKLNLGRRPWTLKNNNLISSGIQLKLISDPVQEYFEYGYWISDEFMPNCYAEYYRDIPVMPKRRTKKGETPVVERVYLEPIDMVRFRGMVACGRNFNAEKRMEKAKQLDGGEPITPIKTNKMITFLTIGVADSSYLDLVLYGCYPVSKIIIIEGEGLLKDKDTVPYVQVIRFRFSRL